MYFLLLIAAKLPLAAADTHSTSSDVQGEGYISP